MAKGSDLIWATAVGTAVFGVFWAPSASAQTTPADTWTGPYLGIFGANGTSQRRVNLNISERDDAYNYTFDGGVPRPVGFSFGTVYDTAIGAQSLNPWPTSFSFTDSGWGAGAVVGYDHAFGGLVVGLAGDYTYLGHGGSASWTDYYIYQYYDDQDPPEFNQIVRDTEVGVAAGVLDMFTLRLRAGVATDRAFFYGTGGVALGRSWVETYASMDENYIDAAKDATYDVHNEWTGRNQRLGIGYTVGGGVEVAVTPRIGLQFEGLYYNLGRVTATAEGETTLIQDGGDPSTYPAQPYTVDTVADGALFKFGITFRP